VLLISFFVLNRSHVNNRRAHASAYFWVVEGDLSSTSVVTS
jgi:hypothetical protein